MMSDAVRELEQALRHLRDTIIEALRPPLETILELLNRGRRP